MLHLLNMFQSNYMLWKTFNRILFNYAAHVAFIRTKKVPIWIYVVKNEFYTFNNTFILIQMPFPHDTIETGRISIVSWLNVMFVNVIL